MTIGFASKIIAAAEDAFAAPIGSTAGILGLRENSSPFRRAETGYRRCKTTANFTVKFPGCHSPSLRKRLQAGPHKVPINQLQRLQAFAAA
jgi:hypothetical protein